MKFFEHFINITEHSNVFLAKNEIAAIAKNNFVVWVRVEVFHRLYKEEIIMFLHWKHLIGI